jgi:hypothetical protein
MGTGMRRFEEMSGSVNGLCCGSVKGFCCGFMKKLCCLQLRALRIS